MAAGVLQELQSSGARQESPVGAAVAAMAGAAAAILSLFPPPGLTSPPPAISPGAVGGRRDSSRASADSPVKQRTKRLLRPPSRHPDAQRARRSPSPL